MQTGRPAITLAATVARPATWGITIWTRTRSADMGGLAAGDVWLPTRTDGSLWLRGGIVNAGRPGVPGSTYLHADERAG